MKIDSSIEKLKFEPITINIKIESLDELNTVYNTFAHCRFDNYNFLRETELTRIKDFINSMYKEVVNIKMR